MTEEQKFLFDVRGWLLLPAVLDAAQIEMVKAHLTAGGDSFTGPAAELLDHPVVVDILNEILSPSAISEETYNFRCESSFVTIRQNGWKPGATDIPHVVLPPQSANAMRYQCQGGKIYSGLTRVVWELNPVERSSGGTLFLSGSHKANIPYPPSVREVDNAHLEAYSCPAGSVIIFTESLLHAATTWKDANTDRIAIFNCYNSVWAQWHRLNLDHARIEAMPPKRRTLFRGVYAIDFTARPVSSGVNREYGIDNRSL